MEKAFKKRFVILMLPTLIAFIIAFIIPFVLGIYLSFTKFTTVRCPVDWAEQLYCGIPG